MDHPNHNYTDPWDNGVYGTGKTEPPKNNNAVIALLLMLIIFLSGIVSVLSFWNIRLFHQLQQVKLEEDAVPIAFSGTENMDPELENVLEAAYEQDQAAHIPELGIHGEFITSFDQYYFNWPAGMMITEIEEGSQADHLGLESGDILISINSHPVTGQEALASCLECWQKETETQLLIFRDGNQYTFNGNNTD